MGIARNQRLVNRWILAVNARRFFLPLDGHSEAVMPPQSSMSVDYVAFTGSGEADCP